MLYKSVNDGLFAFFFF